MKLAVIAAIIVISLAGIWMAHEGRRVKYEERRVEYAIYTVSGDRILPKDTSKDGAYVACDMRMNCYDIRGTAFRAK